MNYREGILLANNQRLWCLYDNAPAHYFFLSLSIYKHIETNGFY